MPGELHSKLEQAICRYRYSRQLRTSGEGALVSTSRTPGPLDRVVAVHVSAARARRTDRVAVRVRRRRHRRRRRTVRSVLKTTTAAALVTRHCRAHEFHHACGRGAVTGCQVNEKKRKQFKPSSIKNKIDDFKNFESRCIENTIQEYPFMHLGLRF